MMTDVLKLADLLPAIRCLHDRIRFRVLAALETRSAEELSRIVGDEGGDIVFALDRVSERELLDFVDEELAAREPIVVVAEGLSGGKVVLPLGAREQDCRWRMIFDPIDGTRCLLHQKRSGWILTGVAPNRGADTRLGDVQLAVQTEIPVLKQHLSDQMWTTRGLGTRAERCHVVSDERQRIQLRPSPAKTIQLGYAAISRFFPGLRDVLAAIDDEVIYGVLGPVTPGSTLTFEDQYPSTGGQIHALASGADRFVADLRPLLRPLAEQRREHL